MEHGTLIRSNENIGDGVIPKIKAYIELTKPRALMMIVFTTGLSYLIAATDAINPVHLFYTLFGVCIAGGGSLALNQHMERELDSRMERTRSRPIPSGRIKSNHAFIYGMAMMIVGYAFLWLAVNPLCSLATIACGVSYLYMYTPLKLRSSFSSFVGAIPGGLLPVMGWTAARGKLEIGAWILFVILFLWQIPHALIISIRHHRDYESVGMRQLPIISTYMTTKRQIMLNVLVLVPVTILPAFVNMTNYRYPIFALILGFLLFLQVLDYVMRSRETAASRVFVSLTAYLPLLLLAMYFDKPV